MSGAVTGYFFIPEIVGAATGGPVAALRDSGSNDRTLHTGDGISGIIMMGLLQ